MFTYFSRYDGIRYGHRSSDDADLHTMITNTRSEAFGVEVQRRILTGTFVLSASAYDSYFEYAQRVRNRVKKDFSTLFSSGYVLDSMEDLIG